MPTPPEIFERMRQNWLANRTTFDEETLTEDVVIEVPFAAPGQPTRVEGRQNVMAWTTAGRAGTPVRFDDCRHVVVHHTVDPDVIVVEYELVGTHLTTGTSAAAPFIGVLRSRDGRLAQWREYQHTVALAAALGG